MLNQNVLNEFVLNLKVKYKNKIEHLELKYQIDDYGECINLAPIKIKRSQRETGYGAAIMSDIINLADRNNVRIILYTTNDLKRLYEFYGKLGFVLMKATDDHMIYFPSNNVHS
jgi:GNAT superfamily N-acetyltransferase